MRKVFALLAAIGLSTATFVQTVHADVVVELYTSQGCSSCPPADALLGELTKRDGVIALSLHVDYWDYLGWKDEFANAAYTNRQRGYAAAAGDSTIYTPQMVIGGKDHIIGTRSMSLVDTLNEHIAKAVPVELEARYDSGTLSVSANVVDGMKEGMIVQLVQYTPEETVSIQRGENAGREMTYHNVVKGWSQIAEWDGTAPLDLKADVTASEPMVVIVQHAGHGTIVAATKVQ